MREIAPGVYIDETYLGVTLGAIARPHGILLIDAPPQPDDVRAWRSALLNLGTGVDRLLINLDSHLDRTLGARAMECTIVAHERTAQAFRNRPTTFKGQGNETGAAWEQSGALGSVRWAPPEITFSQHMAIYWGDGPVLLEYHPGPNPGAIWVTLPEDKVVFLGDAVTPSQPPFLAHADLGVWIENLQPLLDKAYRDAVLVSGRDGLVTREDVKAQIDLLKKIQTQVTRLAERKENPEATGKLVSGLITGMKVPAEDREVFTQRLRWGLLHYYTRHYRPSSAEEA